MRLSEMIIYCLIYPVLTLALFFVWMSMTTLPGGEIGMAPFLVGLILLVAFAIEIFLVLIFKKALNLFRNKIIALIIGFFIYEIVAYFMTGEVAILNAFNRPFRENEDVGFSFSSIISLILIFGLILIKRKKNVTQHRL